MEIRLNYSPSSRALGQTRPSIQAQTLVTPLSFEQSVEAHQRLDRQALAKDWSMNTLRAKRGWITRRTLGWRARAKGDGQ